MTRLIVTLLTLTAALSAATDEHKPHRALGAVLGRQTIDAGHVLEARAITGKPGVVLIRWGDVGNAIDKGNAKGSAFSWGGSASCPGITLIKDVAFEDGTKREAKPAPKAVSKKDAKPNGGTDQLTNDNDPNTVTWNTKTSSAWDGVLVKAASGSTMSITSGPATIRIVVP